jgi:Chitobiase/beta-hexosaminidase C-terminal domain
VRSHNDCRQFSSYGSFRRNAANDAFKNIRWRSYILRLPIAAYIHRRKLLRYDTICRMRLVSDPPYRHLYVRRPGTRSVLNRLILCVATIWMAVLLSAGLRAEQVGEQPFGIAWRVQGVWREEGSRTPIQTGGAIAPGSLLQPGRESPHDSIVVLLPDGQRILYECFTQKECARGFRVPGLYRAPDRFSVETMAHIRAALSRRIGDSANDLDNRSALPRDEALVAIGRRGQVEIGGLATALPDGRYSYVLHRVGSGDSGSLPGTFNKRGARITLRVPSTGLYDATIVDALHRQRIDLFVAAVHPAGLSSVADSFHRVETLLAKWNDNYQGWPVHQFQRAYLESLVLNLPMPHPRLAVAANAMQTANVTAEPVFSPRPGAFDGSVAVALHCETPGAAIHFTVDSSEPIDSSPAYAAPIVVKGTELTIKAFASAPGHKDSAVVTGIFRIRE